MDACDDGWFFRRQMNRWEEPQAGEGGDVDKPTSPSAGMMKWIDVMISSCQAFLAFPVFGGLRLIEKVFFLNTASSYHNEI